VFLTRPPRVSRLRPAAIPGLGRFRFGPRRSRHFPLSRADDWSSELLLRAITLDYARRSGGLRSLVVAARFGWSLALVAQRSITVWPTGPRRFAR